MQKNGLSLEDKLENKSHSTELPELVAMDNEQWAAELQTEVIIGNELKWVKEGVDKQKSVVELNQTITALKRNLDYYNQRFAHCVKMLEVDEKRDSFLLMRSKSQIDEVESYIKTLETIAQMYQKDPEFSAIIALWDNSYDLKSIADKISIAFSDSEKIMSEITYLITGPTIKNANDWKQVIIAQKNKLLEHFSQHPLSLSKIEITTDRERFASELYLIKWMSLIDNALKAKKIDPKNIDWSDDAIYYSWFWLGEGDSISVDINNTPINIKIFQKNDWKYRAVMWGETNEFTQVVNDNYQSQIQKFLMLPDVKKNDFVKVRTLIDQTLIGYSKSYYDK